MCARHILYWNSTSLQVSYLPWLILTDHRIKFNLDSLHTPKTHDEIATIVTLAHTKGRKVRVLAAGHSWSEIAQTQDIMISLHDYTGIEVHGESLTVTVKAGTSLRELSKLLDAQGLAMINLGSVAAQSLGGAISTGEALTSKQGGISYVV